MSDGSVSIRSTARGRQVVYYLDEISRQWRHPWFITGFYDEEQWKIQIKPGFVNGEAVLAGSDEEDETRPGANKLLPLTDFPAIPLRKGIFERPKRAPEFFKRLGVKDPPELKVDTSFEVLAITAPAPEESSADDRTLLQCVVFLTQARATHRMDVDIPGNLLLANLVEYKMMWDSSALTALGGLARISVAKDLPKNPTPDLFDLLSGTVQDDGLDHLLMATLYFVSPRRGDNAGTEEEPKEPDAKWQLYVKHEVFWNMGYGARNPPPINIPGLGVDPFLAAFVGRYTFAPMATLGALNAMLSRALMALFNSNSNRGRFWTV